MTDLRRLPLSALDLSTVGSGSDARAALRGTIDLARRVEQLGFTRFWLAEHHAMPGIASSSPPVVIGAVAAATTTLRVGSGGVMLPNHAPLVVAEQFGTLEALHPGRIDLGLGRAPGTDQLTAHALRRGLGGTRGGDDFPEQLGELLAFFRGSFPDDHPYQRIRAVPGVGYEPPVWLLGSSGYSAQLAGMLGLPFAFAHHFSAENTVPALDLYRSSFEPSAQLSAPWAMICVNVVAADDDERARWLAAPSSLSFARLRQGSPGPLPSPEEAAAHDWSAAETAFADQRASEQAVGSAGTVRERLATLLGRTAADELMVTSQVHGYADRVRSYEIVRDLFGPEPLPQGLGRSTPLAVG